MVTTRSSKPRPVPVAAMGPTHGVSLWIRVPLYALFVAGAGFLGVMGFYHSLVLPFYHATYILAASYTAWLLVTGALAYVHRTQLAPALRVLPGRSPLRGTLLVSAGRTSAGWSWACSRARALNASDI